MSEKVVALDVEDGDEVLAELEREFSMHNVPTLRVNPVFCVKSK